MSVKLGGEQIKLKTKTNGNGFSQSCCYSLELHAGHRCWDQAAAHLIGGIRSAVVKGISTTGSGRQVLQPTSGRDGESHASTQLLGRQKTHIGVKTTAGVASAPL